MAGSHLPTDRRDNQTCLDVKGESGICSCVIAEDPAPNSREQEGKDQTEPLL